MENREIVAGIRAALHEMSQGTGDGDDAAREILLDLVADLEKSTVEAEAGEPKVGDRVTVDRERAQQVRGVFAVTTGKLTAITPTGTGPLDRIGTITSDGGDVESHVPPRAKADPPAREQS